ncbi:helix-turn-helix domain-containing protein [Streptomyces sp. NPDC127098]|uniref:helix-turn-helix domain-containing protein n=1 Tax=Streptomyces sp. NPDC127098 TaxID=3347137 RepID=UPI00365E8E99
MPSSSGGTTVLRIHFSDADLARTRIAAAPDPLWEVASSLHRLQSRTGRWAYAGWYRSTRQRVAEHRLERLVREVLVPLFPRAAYFPDFLTPSQSEQGLEAGLEAIAATPTPRVARELRLFERRVGAPSWIGRLTRGGERAELLGAIRTYHAVALAPADDLMRARVDAERAARARNLLDGGVHALLDNLGPSIRWRPPVLHVDYPAEEREMRLDGRGLRLVPSYFCWGSPVSMYDPELPPVLFYPLLHEPAPLADDSGEPLTALLGRTRATVLRAAASGAGATTGELARAAAVSDSSASRHASVLREAGLLSSSRFATSVLHTLTPAGAAMLRAGRRPPG